MQANIRKKCIPGDSGLAFFARRNVRQPRGRQKQINTMKIDSHPHQVFQIS